MSKLTQHRQSIAKELSVHYHSMTVDINGGTPVILQDSCLFKYGGLTLEARDSFDYGPELSKVKTFLSWIFMFILGTHEQNGLGVLGYEFRRSGSNIVVFYRGSLVATKSGLRAASNLIQRWYKLQESSNGHV